MTRTNVQGAAFSDESTEPDIAFLLYSSSSRCFYSFDPVTPHSLVSFPSADALNLITENM